MKSPKQSEEILRLVTENVPDVIYSLDGSGAFLSVSPSVEKLLGYRVEALIGTSVFLLVHDDDRARMKSSFMKSIRESDSAIRRYRFRMVSKEGRVKHIESNRQLYFENGKVIRSDGILRDVSERIKLEKQIEERSESLGRLNEDLDQKAKELEKKTYLLANANVELLSIQEQLEEKNAEMESLLQELTRERNFISAVLNTAGALVIVLDTNGTIVRFNRACEVSSGYRVDEVVGKKIWDVLLNHDDAELFRKQFEKMSSSRSATHMETALRTKEGQSRIISWSNTVILTATDEVEYIVTAGIDITVRKKFEESLRISEERFRSLVENANDIIFSLTPEGDISYVSPRFTELLGYAVPNYLGTHFTDVFHAEDVNASKKWFENELKGNGKPGAIEFRLIHSDGSIHWFLVNSSVIFDESGNAIEMIGVAHDFTDMRKVLDDLEEANCSLKETQSQLVQSEKMASLGMLVAGIAHEINTPIGAVNSMHDTLFRAINRMKSVIQQRLTKEPEVENELANAFKIIEKANKVIQNGTNRVIEIVRRLRSFARLDEADLKDADIHEGLEDTLTLIHHEIKHDIKVTRNFGEIPRITCYPGQLNQVFLNLLINARQAISGKGEIRISTSHENGEIRVAFQDNGSGISKTDIGKIFDPGFTTKGSGVGTGLGLSICYQIIHDHNGTIEVESVPGEGTTFTVVLPVVNGLEATEANGVQ
ncbi:MAG: PAS domain S-box protein [candidate division KSB1 bacterium]|jgi:PAS domain S-box-containing protein|nr:PAS domain S-box protein [candidate division KSB1 bacterium]